MTPIYFIAKVEKLVSEMGVGEGYVGRAGDLHHWGFKKRHTYRESNNINRLRTHPFFLLFNCILVNGNISYLCLESAVLVFLSDPKSSYVRKHVHLPVTSVLPVHASSHL